MLELLYQDDHCVAINKPAGMLVHRSWLDRHETQFVLQTLRDQLGQYVYPIHRLDRPTSGVLLFGLSSASARLLCAQFDSKQVQKTYLAIVRGYLTLDGQTSGLIDYPLTQILDKIADKPSLQALTQSDDQQAFELEEKFRDNPVLTMVQPAQTQWQCLATTEQPFQARSRYPTSRFSLATLTPITGRKHQLRRHMKHVFHPIIGDTSYGDHHQNRAIREHIGVHRLMLHAHTLSFNELSGNSRVDITAPVDADWQQLCQQFDFKLP